MTGLAGPAEAADLARAAAIGARVAALGGLPVDAYMRLCLLDEEHGYYRRSLAIGAAGDFVTAPEISQIFGELIGAWCVVVWESMGRPAPLRLVELGPGRGTLLADLLRVVRRVPDLCRALTLHLIEASERLTAIQRQTLAAAPVPVTWSRTIERPEGATIVLANEFLDALPVRQLVRTEDGWRERLVVAGADGRLAFRAGPPAMPPAAVPGLSEAPAGSILEIQPDLPCLAESLGGWARQAPLAALLVDYGHWGPRLGETLQAVRRHAYADPLDRPGATDLSVLVDFQALAAAAERAGLTKHGPVTQAGFLGALGLPARAARLMSGVGAAEANRIESAAARLMAPAGMGGRFLVLGLASAGLAPLPGL